MIATWLTKWKSCAINVKWALESSPSPCSGEVATSGLQSSKSEFRVPEIVQSLGSKWKQQVSRTLARLKSIPHTLGCPVGTNPDRVKVIVQGSTCDKIPQVFFSTYSSSLNITLKSTNTPLEKHRNVRSHAKQSNSNLICNTPLQICSGHVQAGTFNSPAAVFSYF